LHGHLSELTEGGEGLGALLFLLGVLENSALGQALEEVQSDPSDPRALTLIAGGLLRLDGLHLSLKDRIEWLLLASGWIKRGAHGFTPSLLKTRCCRPSRASDSPEQGILCCLLLSLGIEYPLAGVRPATESTQ
jgi:hypothetical protein